MSATRAGAGKKRRRGSTAGISIRARFSTGGKRGNRNLIADVLADETLLEHVDAPVPVGVLPAEERETRDEERGEPNGADHERYPAEGALLDVIDARHRPVPASNAPSH